MQLIKTKTEEGHLHAWCLYERTSWKHFLVLLLSTIKSRLTSAKSVTTHLPLEFQHRVYKNIGHAWRLIVFGRFLAALFQIKLYWENAPLLRYGTWDLKHGPVDWSLVPANISLCFDTGHEMLGASNAAEAQERILNAFRLRQSQIKHIHLHENDLVHDLHNPPEKILTPQIITELTKDRTYIFEK